MNYFTLLCIHKTKTFPQICLNVSLHGCNLSECIFKTGTPVQDTECETCPPGTFSAEKSSTAVCVAHSSCAASGLREALKGSEWHDNICMSCKEQEAKGRENILVSQKSLT